MFFSGRPKLVLTVATEDRHSIPMSEGQIWKDHRRFALNVLRDCGLGKNSIEPLILNEIQHFLAEVKKTNGKPTDFSELLTLSVSNNICILIFGKRFEYDDPWFISAKRLFGEFVGAATTVSLLQFFPWIKKIPKIEVLMNQKTLVKNLNSFKETMYIKISERKKRYIDGQRDNYLNAFIDEQSNRLKKDKNDNTFPDIAMEENVRGLMAAGTETTANTICWLIVSMMLNPEVQKKVQKELDEVIGTERAANYADRQRTPYTEATICEVQRRFTLVPNNVPHKNFEECEIMGYKIPKNSFILSNIWAVHMDPKLWKDPEEFRPERFLNENGELDRKEYLIPFSMGKRQCLGENLARMELYLYFTTMLQKFTFKSPNGKKPSIEPRIGITVGPKYFSAIAEARHAE